MGFQHMKAYCAQMVNQTANFQMKLRNKKKLFSQQKKRYQLNVEPIFE